MEFIYAAERGDCARMRELYHHAKCFPNLQDEKGWTALHRACFNGNVEIVKFLFGLDELDVNSQGGFGYTPLSIACRYGFPEVVSVLMGDKRVDVNQPDDVGDTPFWWACYQGKLPVVEVLLASGRPIDTTTNPIQMDSPAITARNWGHHSIADLIESYERNPVKITKELRKKLGLQDQDIGNLFALVVYFTDGYLKPKENTAPESTVNFFFISSRLPLEFQMISCHRVFGSPETIIKTKHSEPAFQKYTKE